MSNIEALKLKVLEQIRLLTDLLSKLPPGSDTFKPRPLDPVRGSFDEPGGSNTGNYDGGAGGVVFSVAELAGHLPEAASGFCAALHRARPSELGYFESFKDRERNVPMSPDRAISELQFYARHIEEGFDLLSDEELAVPHRTRFANEERTLLTILLGNFEHLVNHKYQLFFYLKLMGVSIGTPDLYAIEG